MKVAIDFSVFTKEVGSFGNVSGYLSLPVVPQVGDSVSFLFTDNDTAFDSNIGFSGILKVTDRIIAANQQSQPVALALQDVVVPTVADAKKLMQYFESAFGLFAVYYSE